MKRLLFYSFLCCLILLVFPLYAIAAVKEKAVTVENNTSTNAKSEKENDAKKQLTPKEIETKKIELLMEQARQSMIKHDYRTAISRYTAVIRYEGTDFFQAALEYLGLARERNKQYAHAKAEYERYLRLFPEGEGAVRVEQRLSGLLSASFEPKKKLRKSKKATENSGWVNYGSVMQFYRRDKELQQTSGELFSASTAYSSFFYTAKIKTAEYEMNNRVSISNNYDFEEDDEDNDLLKISKLYSELYSQKLKLSGRLGRQTENSSGTYGRFDGLMLAYHYNPRVALRAVSGFPVDFDSYGSIQSNKRFYSANLEIESLYGYVDVNTYFITQYFDDILDRQAMGLELRHFDKKLTFFSTFDYDLSYSVINNVVLNVNYQLRPKHSLGTYLTYRRSPLITTSNALQGQGVSTLDELLTDKTKDELRALARDRTARYVSANVSWRHRLTKKLEMNYDYTLSRLSGTATSGGVVGNEGTGFEHYYSAQFIATDMFSKNDISILGLRYESRFNSDRTSVNLIRRDRIDEKLSFGTKLRIDYQKRKSGENISDLRPSSKVGYKISRKVKLEFELGIQHRIRENSLDDNNETNGFFSLGYIAQF